jgi:hypothetical protein
MVKDESEEANGLAPSTLQMVERNIRHPFLLGWFGNPSVRKDAFSLQYQMSTSRTNQPNLFGNASFSLKIPGVD